MHNETVYANVRRGNAQDLGAVAAIQADSPEAAHWNPASYLRYDFLVAECEGEVAGFLAGRLVAPDERELLNLAVAVQVRRHGIGRALVHAFLDELGGTVYLEVRESNKAARSFYKSLNFKEVTIRPRYYDTPEEAAIVMKFHSC